MQLLFHKDLQFSGCGVRVSFSPLMLCWSQSVPLFQSDAKYESYVMNLLSPAVAVVSKSLRLVPPAAHPACPGQLLY